MDIISDNSNTSSDDIINKEVDDYEYYSTTENSNMSSSTLSNMSNSKKIKFTSKEIYFLKTIDNFFNITSIEKMQQMYNIINGSANISLRLLDWFVTRYAKKHKISYFHQQEDEEFNVHIGYKAQLKSYKKRYFDPFRRRRKFYYVYNFSDSCKKLLTTIGQLNFFMWAIYYNIIDYVEKNYKTIDASMTKANKEDKLKKKPEKIPNKKLNRKVQIGESSTLIFE